jgi:hypothetical protein
MFSDYLHFQSLMGWAPYGTSIATLGSFPQFNDPVGVPSADSQTFLHTDVTPTAGWCTETAIGQPGIVVCSTVGTMPNGYDHTDSYIYSEREAGAVGGVNAFSG